MNNNNTTYKTIKKIRNDWGAINPVTKIIPNKKKNYEYPEYYDEDIIEWLEKYDDFDFDYDCDL